jgi:pyruvate/2-oxoacid:ferredoxin oxidoreductase beta subunit
MTVIAVAGDDDCYGEGGNHLLHAIRRNVNITLFVHNNQIYGLTKGQASPTSIEGFALLDILQNCVSFNKVTPFTSIRTGSIIWKGRMTPSIE